MKKLYLHIGLGKTGSSALQSWLSLNSEALGRQGIDYADTVPEVKYGESLSGNGSLLHKACVSQDFDEVERLLMDTYFFNPSNSVAIVSCELMQGIRPSTILILREICEKNEIEVRVIAYVRSVYEVLYSTYNQFVKRSTYTHRFGEKSSDIDFSTTVEYLKRYLEVFGDKMIVLNYDQARKDIYASFSEVTGIERKGLKKYNQKVNRSLSIQEAEVLRLVNALHKGVFSTLISNYVISLSPAIQTAVQYDEVLVQQVRKETEQDLRWINKQFGLAPSLVSDYYTGQKGERPETPTRLSYQPVLQWAMKYDPPDNLIAAFSVFLKEFSAFMVEFSSEDALSLIRRAHVIQKNIVVEVHETDDGECKGDQQSNGPRFLISYFHDVESPAVKFAGSPFASNFYAWLDLIQAHTVGSTIYPLEDTVTLSSDNLELLGSRPPMSGYSIIEVDNMSTALSLAEKCPLREIGGIVAVSHIVDLHQGYTTKSISSDEVDER